eukprot:GHVU01189844.1.p1 GENE.GHVU01189844.1~~GHVU01189844.1.p1  ORF type:complete len:167 (+),score=24.68 GHVU01189844.1:1776-2276(+)
MADGQTLRERQRAEWEDEWIAEFFQSFRLRKDSEHRITRTLHSLEQLLVSHEQLLAEEHTRQEELIQHHPTVRGLERTTHQYNLLKQQAEALLTRLRQVHQGVLQGLDTIHAEQLALLTRFQWTTPRSRALLEEATEDTPPTRSEASTAAPTEEELRPNGPTESEI